MHEMSVQNIFKELEGVKAYMASRPQTPGASDSVAKSFAASMLKMISVCNFISPHDAAKLSSALSDSMSVTPKRSGMLLTRRLGI